MNRRKKNAHSTQITLRKIVNLNPPIPKGWINILTAYSTEFVIRSPHEKAEFVWFNSYEYSEIDDIERIGEEEKASMQKYKGFYRSRYPISKDEKGMAVLKESGKPWTNPKFEDVKELMDTLQTQELFVYVLYQHYHSNKPIFKKDGYYVFMFVL